jgi:hypothetical protein
MAIMDFLWMTKAKLTLLIILLIVLIPKYYNSNCDAAICAGDIVNSACQCGFSLANFYTIFVISYIAACIMGEIYKIAKNAKLKRVH